MRHYPTTNPHIATWMDRIEQATACDDLAEMVNLIILAVAELPAQYRYRIVDAYDDATCPKVRSVLAAAAADHGMQVTAKSWAEVLG